MAVKNFSKLYIALITGLILNLSSFAQTGVRVEISEYNIEDCLNQFDSSKIVPTGAGYQYWFVDKLLAGGKTLKLSVVSPNNATHSPHTHPEDEIFFILEGEAEVFLNGKSEKVKANTSFYCPPNIEHGIKNAGIGLLKYLVIKQYPSM